MNIAILVFPSKRRDNNPIFGEAEQMASAAKLRGHSVSVMDASHFSFVFNGDSTSLHYNGEPFIEPDLAIAWVGMLNGVAERTAVLQEIELRGIPVVNKRLPVIRTRNKFQTMQILSSVGLPVIKTVLLQDLTSLDFGLAQLGDFPVVAKTVYGNDGKGVAIFESKRSLLSGLELMLDNNVATETILLQEFVKANNKDYRLFVVGDKVVAQMERSAPGEDFRANLSGGGAGKKTELPLEVQQLAVEAARCLDLDISGVDILISEDKGPIICEVNPRPGFKICQITGVDVTHSIIELAEYKAGAISNDQRYLAANS
ncbi:MAG: RimK family alpha-L-glutamate ligase [Bdellovibrionales bacterium]|nr:RimK family alpha-L-glutamate ligase [Bdellovibrionales bacterium]